MARIERGALGAQRDDERRNLDGVKTERFTKVIGRFPGETGCLTLVWAALDLVITNETNDIRFTQLDRQHLNRIQYQDPEQTVREEVNAA